ncbi:conserved hypothetical protein [Leishmania braziliensis MHOM/BR/75/M2904]|uniref:Uncharacterized protein n=2 Tax=Leishmania braziliensis TaxID=5660 RepID=A4HQI3_LEIBR|nr:conserved hypothetical protein [Leishmania braziliensis MHOM/BR/75/M2904]CAJ2482328.1 unnamed protein product [Leishmania braziliensis]CAJ2482577.1 unnamed protein product [Leishmania braziliensis]CAM44449.1 conserved hypothetical protein [Leishmania braziliensis MHOM/BR/75/M2904]SYZ70527.1 hypothetical_protein [Leishmania braziliensis MHOM/BR/75/M2904]
MAYRHGSHPCHGFDELAAAPAGRQCSVCKALSDGSDVRWFGCVASPCEFLLCEKCFTVQEELLAQPQVVIRNPMLDYDDGKAAVHTRPREQSYRLSPLYAGRLLRVVSTAVDVSDPSREYYRIASGGWINRSHVVCVHPHPSPSMQLLSEVHLNNRKLGSDIASGAVSISVLYDLLHECMQTIDENEAYGIVMSALVMYPLLSTLEIHCCHFRTAPDPLPLVEYVHFVLHFVLTKLVERMDMEEAQFVFKLVDGAMAFLFGDVLARCLGAAYHLAFTWKVRLPSSFAYLVSRALATMDRLLRLLPEEASEQSPALCAPAVTLIHNSRSVERQRLGRLIITMTDMGSCLLQHCIRETRLDLDVLQPLRDQLCGDHRHHLSKVFCEALATMAEVDLLRVQRTYLHLDALEVVGGLAANSCLAESQVAVFRLVKYLAKQCPHNIAMLSAVLLDKLLKMLADAQSPAVYVEAMECFYEMAFNDPRIRGADAGASEMPQPQPHACTAHTGTSGGTAEKANTPYQLLCVYRLPFGGVLMPLCSYCAMHHPPSGGDLMERPQYAYFQCHCHHCSTVVTRSALQVPQLPTIPQTTALNILEEHLPKKVFALSAYLQIPQALNALGRLLLRVALQDEVLVRVIEELVRYPSLESVPYAALVVKANAHLPAVKQCLARYANTELSRYVHGTFEVATPAKNYVDETPAKSHQRSELGLSASPYTNSTVQSGSMYDMRGVFSCSRDGARGVQLFGAGASVEE